jgi:hypothetical protein
MTQFIRKHDQFGMYYSPEMTMTLCTVFQTRKDVFYCRESHPTSSSDRH